MYILTCSPDVKKLSPDDSMDNNRLAFSVAEEHLGIASLIKPTEMEKPDRLALVTYLSLFYELFQDSHPVTPKTASGNTLEVSPVKVNPTSTKEPTPSKGIKSSHEKLASSSKKQDTQTEKPFYKPATSTQKSVVKEPAANTSRKTHESIEKSHKKQDTLSEKQAVSDTIQFTTEEDKSGKKLEISTVEPVTKDQTASPDEPHTKKKKKRKFRIFRRKKKNKSLATSKPSVERYVSIL